MRKPRAIIADDEEELRAYLRKALHEAWPELEIVGEVENGLQALSVINDEEPDVAFLDIKMPGLTGINVAKYINNISHVVFITAYSDYATKAFDVEAVDYLLKPIEPNRLSKTVNRLRDKIANREYMQRDWTDLIHRLNNNTQKISKNNHIRWIKAFDNDEVHIIPIEEVIYFKADEKYTSVVTKNKEWLIRKPVKELEAELDPDMYWRIHRSTIVNASHIVSASRMLNGSYKIILSDQIEPLIASRAYAHLFKRM